MSARSGGGRGTRWGWHGELLFPALQSSDLRVLLTSWGVGGRGELLSLGLGGKKNLSSLNLVIVMGRGGCSGRGGPWKTS